MEFEWDITKATANFRKHGVSFEEAVLAFRDENAIELIDEMNSQTEARYQVIAMSPMRLLFISFTVRKGKVRVISARKANIRQIRVYNEFNDNN